MKRCGVDGCSGPQAQQLQIELVHGHMGLSIDGRRTICQSGEKKTRVRFGKSTKLSVTSSMNSKCFKERVNA